jgi:hypothetical protein
MKPFIVTGTIIVLLLSACAAPLSAAPSSLQSLPVNTAAVTASAAVTPTLLVFPTPIPEATTPTPTFQPTIAQSTAQATDAATQAAPTPTEAPRLRADQWQQWPVIPAITNRAREIYAKGLALGNNPHAFSKVGDCQFVNVAFFGIYDQPNIYQLPQGYENLQETIAWFSGSFNRESQAVRGGFNVASVFVPLQADPKACKAGETPIACEFRLQRPSIVLISMETGFEGRTATVYEKYMRQIIQFAIDQGALPILATKADNFEGDHSINLTTARLALEYDLPLWNFWRAVQPLPNHGMDAERNDRFHTSVEAWNVRSFTGLQVLDALWRAVRK